MYLYALRYRYVCGPTSCCRYVCDLGSEAVRQGMFNLVLGTINAFDRILSASGSGNLLSPLLSFSDDPTGA